MDSLSRQARLPVPNQPDETIVERPELPDHIRFQLGHNTNPIRSPSETEMQDFPPELGTVSLQFLLGRLDIVQRPEIAIIRVEDQLSRGVQLEELDDILARREREFVLEAQALGQDEQLAVDV